MQITDYLELYDSYLSTLIETNPTDFTKESLRQAVIDTVVELIPLRLDDHQTNKLITSVLNKYRRAVRYNGEIDHYEDSVDSNLLSALLLKYSKREKSFYHAYVRLQQEINCRVAFAENILFLSEQEIEQAVLADIANKSKLSVSKETFYNLLIQDNKESLLEQLHQLLDYKKGKDVAIVIKAMEKLHLIKPYSSISTLHALITSEFGDIGGLRNFSNYMQEKIGYQIEDSDIEKYVNLLA